MDVYDAAKMLNEMNLALTIIAVAMTVRVFMEMTFERLETLLKWVVGFIIVGTFTMLALIADGIIEVG